MRKKKTAKSATKLKAGKPKRDEPETAHDDSDQKMDFGGLPDRDLKKNLGGCG